MALFSPAIAGAQNPATANPQDNANWATKAARQVRIGENHIQLFGGVEMEQGDTKIYADAVEWFVNEDSAVLVGNVVVAQGTNRIAAERAELNTKTHLGTFYDARGIASVQQPRRSASPGGFAVPMLANPELDVYFFGEQIEKIGFKKYRITNGGFTTCVQPTPRWDLTAGTVVLNIDHYTFLRQAMFKVKGVPMLYLPIMYYPTKEENRATGFLIPTYGTSTIRGQSIHNAFFWAINRSQDATIAHDWYTKTGNGFGTEYRYDLGGGSSGTLNNYVLDQHVASYVQPDGSLNTVPGSRSFMINGGANQLFPGGLRARGRVSYFSSITTNQTFHTNVYDAASNNRSYGGNVVGAWRSYTLNGTFERNEWFSTTTSSAVTGSSPRVSFNRNERPLFEGSPVYFSVGTEVAHLDRQTRNNEILVDDRTLSRLDLTPQIRYPFKKWQWFTVNSTVSWRDTYYTRSLNPETAAVEDRTTNRQYFTMLAQAVGPVFTRVWNTPDSHYAERLKHTIEPFVNIQRTSSIDNFREIIVIDGTDTIVGGTTSYAYGLNNRLYAKRKVGQISQAQQILSVELTQSYYTDARASQFDPRYNTSFLGAEPSKFSPIALTVRGTPTTDVNGTLRAEFDSRHRELRTLSANGSYNWNQRLQTTIGWSHKFFIKDLAGFNDERFLDHYVNVASNVHTRDNRYGAMYSFNYDVLRSTMLQQRVSAFYNAQCCGLAFEYQRYNFGGIPSFIVPSDHRFFLSFTLAGLGNFSPFNGALSGVPR
jgi:LPS-assembly protein